jgi:hypothetical protein
MAHCREGDVMSEYRKFSARSHANAAAQKTLAGLASLAEANRVLESYRDTNEVQSDPPKTQSGPAKVAKLAKVCVQCGVGGELWTLDTPAGTVVVHEQCARFLPKLEPAEPSAGYQATSAEPDGTACKVEIVELPPGGRYRKVFGVLQLKPPALVDVARWRQCVEDGKRFLAKWGEQAQALNWSSADLFGLIEIPERPSPSFNRLSRYDRLGLCWLLQGRTVVALTADAAAIENPTGAITTYRRFNKPALGPVGDSLDDFA